MVQIIGANPRPSFAQSIAGGLADAAPQAFQQHFANKQQKQQMQMENQAIKQNFGIDLSGISNPDQRKAIVSEMLKGQGKEQQFQQKQDYLSQVFGGNKQQQPGQQPQQNQQQQDQADPQGAQGFDASKFSDEDIARATAIDPNLGRSIQHAKDVALRENRESKENERKQFESERAYHTQFSKEAEKEVEGIRSTLAKKEMSLNLSRDAVESGEVGALSLANLAQLTGRPELQTMKGAQLETAVKENLLSNMSRVSAKGQNIWFEKRLSSMMAQIGKSEEANLAAQEILEGEVAMDKAYVDNFDRIAEDDLQKYGFEKKDVSKRAHQAAAHQQKEIFKRTAYRMKELEENEKGLSSMKSRVGKNVTKGTPFTMGMAKLYIDKFGRENALKVAEENGYTIPTYEEFSIYNQTPQEYRERFE